MQSLADAYDDLQDGKSSQIPLLKVYRQLRARLSQANLMRPTNPKRPSARFLQHPLRNRPGARRKPVRFSGAMATHQNVLWAIDGAGLVMAASLSAVKYFRKGNDIVAGGFLVFAVGEGVLLSGTAAGPADSVSSFTAGITLWGDGASAYKCPRSFDLPVCISPS